MPIYEYECGACRERTEFIQKFSESPKRKCPECGKLRLKRLISAAAFHLKGDGWYVTDFRDKGKKKEDGESKQADSSNGSDSSSGDGKSSKPDSKADAKSDSKPDSSSSGSSSSDQSKTGKSSSNAAAS
ncbi:MAG: FmdB family zinc ribbon protein [Gammaproteobacteria bacterium]